MVSNTHGQVEEPEGSQGEAATAIDRGALRRLRGLRGKNQPSREARTKARVTETERDDDETEGDDQVLQLLLARRQIDQRTTRAGARDLERGQDFQPYGHSSSSVRRWLFLGRRHGADSVIVTDLRELSKSGEDPSPTCHCGDRNEQPLAIFTTAPTNTPKPSPGALQ